MPITIAPFKGKETDLDANTHPCFYTSFLIAECRHKHLRIKVLNGPNNAVSNINHYPSFSHISK